MNALLKSLAIRAMALFPVRTLARPFLGGRGVIFTLHRVFPAPRDTLVPGIAVTAGFLDAMLTHLRRRGIAVIPVAEALDRLAAGSRGRARFACLTFDDGYRDNLDVALPILRSHGTPFSVYLVSDWVRRRAVSRIAVLERLLLRATEFRLPEALGGAHLPTGTLAEKLRAFRTVDGACWHRPDIGPEVLVAIREQGIDVEGIMEEEFLDEKGARELATDPLCTVGSHTASHPILGKLAEHDVRHELESSRAALKQITGQPVLELAYPYGDPTSCGVREFRLATQAGYRLALTTRPGNLFSKCADRPLALPRTGLSLHAHGHSLHYVDAVLCGARNAAMNSGRRMVVD